METIGRSFPIEKTGTKVEESLDGQNKLKISGSPQVFKPKRASAERPLYGRKEESKAEEKERSI